MTVRPCPHQTEVRAMVARGHWPAACPADLRAHLDECSACAGLLLVDTSFQQARAELLSRAHLPAAGAIWWRAQLRRRNAAQERVSRPLIGAYAFALAVTVLVALTAVVSQARQGLNWLGWLPGSESVSLYLQAFNPVALLGAGGPLVIFIAVLGMVTLLGALAVYLSGERQ